MCHRMSPLTMRELEEGLKYMRATGHARVPRRDPSTVVPDAYPGTQVPLFVLDENDGAAGFPSLRAAELTWGFEGGRRPGLVFNTRIETALRQAQTGSGMWAGPITHGRCLVPVRAFWERWTQPDPKAREVRYGLAGHGIFLLGCVYEGERFSVVTTSPNAEVAAVHNRTPLVLGPGESRIWLGPDWPSLADRSAIRLDAEADEPAR